MPTKSKGPHIAQTEPGALVSFGRMSARGGVRVKQIGRQPKHLFCHQEKEDSLHFLPFPTISQTYLLLDQTTQFVKPGAQLERSCFQAVYQPQLEILQGLVESKFVNI